MEPVTTLISATVGYIAKTIGSSKSFKDFTEDFSNASVDWIRPIFLIDDETPKEVLSDLEKDANDNLNIQAAENAIAKAIRNEPNLEEKLRELVKEIQEKSGNSIEKTNNQTIIGEKNIGIQDVSGGSININSEK